MALEIYVADTGQRVLLQATPADGVRQVIQRLAAETGIPPEAQILLTNNGSTLNSISRIGDYPELKESPVVFLFNRKHIESPPEQSPDAKQQLYETVISPNSFRVEDLPTQLSSVRLENVFERFKDHYNDQLEQAKCFQKSLSQRNRVSEEVVRRIRVNTWALRAAFRSCDHYHQHVNKKFREFYEGFGRLVNENESVFSTFETDLTKLRNVKLHHALRSANKSTLLDMLPEGRYREYLSDCTSRRKLLQKSVNEFRGALENVEKDIKAETGTRFSPIDPLDKKLSECQGAEQIINSLVERISGNLQWLNNQASASRSSRTDDLEVFIKAAQQRDRAHIRELETVKQHDKASTDMLKSIYETDRRAQEYFFQKLVSIKKLQKKGRSCRKKISLWEESTDILRKKFTTFHQKMKQLPEAYKSCVAETKRRFIFQKHILDLISECESKLKGMHDEETKRRRGFDKEHWNFLSPEFFHFLRDSPLKVDIKLRNFSQFPPAICTPDEIPARNEMACANAAAELRLKNMESEMARLREELRRSKEANAELKREVEAEKVSSGCVEASITVSPGQTSVVTPVKVAAVEVPDHTDRLKELRDENDALRTRVEDLQGEIQNLTERENEMKMSMQAKEEQNNRVTQNNTHQEKLISQLNTERKRIEADMEKMSAKVFHLLQENRNLKKLDADICVWKEKAKTRISYTEFKQDDLVLFIKDEKKKEKTYVAFNNGAPNRFLSREAVTAVKGEPKFVVGQIIIIDKGVVRRSTSKDENPFGLPLGTTFYELTAKQIY